MYHCQLTVHVVSPDDRLAQALRRAPVPQRFTCRIEAFSAADGASLTGADILVLDLPGLDPSPILSRLAPEAQVILCVPAGEMAAAQETFGLRCAGLWLSPVPPAFAADRFGRLLEERRLRKDLRLTQAYLDTAIDSIPDLVWFKDLRGSHEKVNNAFCQAVGKTKRDIQGRGHYYIWDLEPDDYAAGEYVCLETEEEVLRRKETCLFDEKVLSKHGLRQFKTYKSPIFDDTGELLGTVGIAHDVTDLENVCTELEILLNSIPFAILVILDQGTVIDVNDKFTEYFSTPRGDILGQSYQAWKERALSGLKPLDAKGYSEVRQTTGDGAERILEIHEEPIFDIFETQVGQLCICRDVTVERNLEEQILHNSNTDFLTGLYNRRWFYDYVGKNRADQRVSLIYVDLDQFKLVNDTYGHNAGDQALILAARVLKEGFPDGSITRLGGDEFLITLLGPYELSDLQARSELLLRRMERAFQSSPQLRILSASIGIAQTDDPSVKLDTLIQQSDQALYTAKQQGRARCHVYRDEAGRGPRSS